MTPADRDTSMRVEMLLAELVVMHLSKQGDHTRSTSTIVRDGFIWTVTVEKILAPAIYPP